MKRIFFLILLFSICFTLNSVAQFSWPNGAKAAVVFTYDDGLDCHLDVAVPQLDEFGFKGTFFCTGNSPSLFNRMEEWRAISKNGHELGNHTIFHPCYRNTNDWVEPEYDLSKYSVEQIVAEMKAANTLLKAIDGKEKRTFAYTCCDFVAGKSDFSGEVEKLFTAARLDGPIPETMAGYDLAKTPSTLVADPTVEDLIALVDEAKNKGTIIVFLFHNVGGGYLNVGAEEHRKLLEYVKAHEDELYSATFMEVMDYIKNNR
ncbi:polysaccharide deacetylase family protein [Maribellus sediminis]|uniref:polysaccharide deacetylase family protein n=1 Tax=Maribellus sediminis TaxID=2696285 RepID=UPI0014314BD8|nr:polysaccharide deacetylase family protein [Maribellus sediminis]